MLVPSCEVSRQSDDLAMITPLLTTLIMALIQNPNKLDQWLCRDSHANWMLGRMMVGVIMLIA